MSKKTFLKAMKIIGVEDDLVETALAQAVYISKDIQHLKYA